MFYKKEVFPYVVILKNGNAKSVNNIGLIISLLSIIMFIGEYFINQYHNIAWLIGAAAIVAVIGWNQYQSSKNRKIFYKPAFLFAALTWASMPYLQWLPLVFVVLYFLEHQAKLPEEIGFSENKIVVNSLINKTIYWDELSNVILKDNLLTIDFKTNKVYQKEVIDDTEPDADENEFNAYCKLQLARNN